MTGSYCRTWPINVSVVRPSPHPSTENAADHATQLTAVPMEYTSSGTRPMPQAIGSGNRKPYANRTASDARQGCRRTTATERRMSFRKRGHRFRSQRPRQRPSR